MKDDVVRWCRQCDKCLRCNLRPGARRAQLRQEPVGSPMERLAFDILSFPEETTHGNRYVLVVCDYFTKWCEAFPLPDHQAITVADTLVTEVFFAIWGPSLHSLGPGTRVHVRGDERYFHTSGDRSDSHLSLPASIRWACRAYEQNTH